MEANNYCNLCDDRAGVYNSPSAVTLFCYSAEDIDTIIAITSSVLVDNRV